MYYFCTNYLIEQRMSYYLVYVLQLVECPREEDAGHLCAFLREHHQVIPYPHRASATEEHRVKPVQITHLKLAETLCKT